MSATEEDEERRSIQRWGWFEALLLLTGPTAVLVMLLGCVFLGWRSS